MKKAVFFLIACTCLSVGVAQDAKTDYERALIKAQNGELDSALILFDTSIALKNDEYVAWYNRAIVKTMMGRYEDALPDLQQTINLNPGYKKAYLNRGTAKRHLTDYGSALSDYTLATQIDTDYAEAYYDRGIVYQMFGKNEAACKDFEKANKLGFELAEIKVKECRDSTNKKPLYPILWLNNTATNYKYGFSVDAPVMVGEGPEGGPANERVYLDLLRDAQEQPVRYRRVGSCCAYASVNAPNGMALLDKYQVTYVNEDKQVRTAIVYFSFFDYNEPLILMGFKTVHSR